MLEFEALGFCVLERGWLSSNNVVFFGGEQTAVVDTGYVTHSQQSVALIGAALRGRRLDRVLNTHLHSDHCGGNAALAQAYPDLRIAIPLGLSDAVRRWDADALSYTPTGQQCPRFDFHEVLIPGQHVRLGLQDWQVHAAPGHDLHAVVLFEPASRTLISADALWENGFGVVFQELDGDRAFEEVADTLDLIEKLAPVQVIPGHGRVFTGVGAALARARSRLDMFVRSPVRHAHYGAKVLIKYKLLELQQCSRAELDQWLDETPYFGTLHRTFFSASSRQEWQQSVLNDLHKAGAIELAGAMIINRD